MNGRYISLILAVQIAHLVQAVRAAGRCDAVFRGFSDCLLRLGDNMANYPQDLDDKRNLQTICAYWDDFHACTLTALTDCQEGATDLWEKLRRESKNLDFQGSLFELCGGGSGAAPSLLPPALPVLLGALGAALATWGLPLLAGPTPHPERSVRPRLWGRCARLWLVTVAVADGGGTPV